MIPLIDEREVRVIGFRLGMSTGSLQEDAEEMMLRDLKEREDSVQNVSCMSLASTIATGSSVHGGVSVCLSVCFLRVSRTMSWPQAQ